jgi:hypothetical protein
MHEGVHCISWRRFGTSYIHFSLSIIFKDNWNIPSEGSFIPSDIYNYCIYCSIEFHVWWKINVFSTTLPSVETFFWLCRNLRESSYCSSVRLQIAKCMDTFILVNPLCFYCINMVTVEYSSFGL